MSNTTTLKYTLPQRLVFLRSIERLMLLFVQGSIPIVTSPLPGTPGHTRGVQLQVYLHRHYHHHHHQTQTIENVLSLEGSSNYTPSKIETNSATTIKLLKANNWNSNVYIFHCKNNTARFTHCILSTLKIGLKWSGEKPPTHSLGNC